MRVIQVGLALVGAVIGAGFASGREVMRFFAQYGVWGYAGAALAAAAMGVLALRVMGLAARCGARSFGGLSRHLLGRFGGMAGGLLFVALLSVTGAAMLSGAGELAAIVLPIGPAYAVGYYGMLLCALLVAWRGMGGLAACGGVLVPLCCCLYVPLILLPAAGEGVALAPVAHWQAIPMALSYAALNIALAAGLLCESGPGLSGSGHRRAALTGGAVLGGLLLLAIITLERGPGELRTAPLPMVALAAKLGKPGFYLSAAVLCLAMLSTLATVLRGLFMQMPEGWSGPIRWMLPCACCFLLGLVGFDSLVGTVYPALGWCAAALIVALCVQPLRFQQKSAILHNETRE
ncbi:MAG: hypothetical protein FWD25_00645 [Clostridia bacterium]|nr:hypothetical protein [Clostridia bacterium]